MVQFFVTIALGDEVYRRTVIAKAYIVYSFEDVANVFSEKAFLYRSYFRTVRIKLYA